MKNNYFTLNIKTGRERWSGMRCLSLLLFSLFMVSGVVEAQVTTVTYITGTGNFTVPAGVTQINVQVYGAGGAGGGATDSSERGGGGGGGGYVSNNIAVTPVQTINYQVGVGGTASNGNGGAGGASTFGTIIANGGLGGNANNGAGGNGGNGSGGTITAGANGLAGNAATNGGRGGANNGPGGGAGGNSLGSAANGDPGDLIGGGGGGGRKGGAFSQNRPGGAGARGQIIVTYTLPTLSLFSAGGSCVGAEVLIMGTNLTGATVTFNGTPATIISNTATAINTTVPVGATTGPVQITVAGGFITIPSFTINPPPTVAVITGNSSVCIGSTTTLANATPGGVWSSSNTGIATVNSSGVVTGVAAGNATIRYTRTVSGCSNAATHAVQVNPLPVVSISGPSSICLNGSTTLSPTSGGTWVSNNPAIASVDAGTGVVTPLAVGNATFTFTNGNSCSATTGPVTVLPNIAIVDNPVPALVCSGSPASFTVNATGPGLTYQWFHGSTQLSNGANISGATAATLNITSAGLPDAGNYHVVVNGTCGGPVTSSDAALTVTQRVVIGNQPAVTQTVCEGDSVSFTVGATGDGLTYQWFNGATQLSNGGSFSGATSATLTINPAVPSDASSQYHVEVSGQAPCSMVNSAFSALVVNAAPSVTGEPAATQTVCAGNSFSLTVAAAGGNLTYQWFNGTTQLNNGGSVSGATSPTLTINPAIPSDTSANYYVVVSNGCATPATSASAQIIVNPTPFIQAQNDSVCSGSTFDFTPVNGIPSAATIVPAGTLYTWTNPVVTGGMTGGSAQTTPQSSISQTLLNSTNSNQTATYTITPVTGSCPGPTFTLVVTVVPAAHVNNPPAQTACSGSAFSFTPTHGLSGNVVPVGTTYSWGLPEILPAGSVIGATDGAGQPSVTQTLENTSGVNGTATYTITATTGSCNESTFTVVFTVRSTPVAAATPLTQSVCSGQPFTGIALSSSNSVAANNYQWSRDQVGIVNGINTSGTGSAITGAMTNTTSAPVTVTFTYRVRSAFGCWSEYDTVTIIVNPALVVAATPTTQSICSGDTITPIIMGTTNNVLGASYSWTRNNQTSVTGIPNSGTGDITGILVNSSASQQNVSFTITATADGCSSATSVVVIQVRPKPTIATTTPPTTLCSGSALSPSVVISNPNGVTSGRVFSWTRDNQANVSGPDSGTGTNINGTYTNNTSVPQIVTFTATVSSTVSSGTCSTSTTFDVTVYPKPTLNASLPSQALCNSGSSAAVNLTSDFGAITWVRQNNANVTTTGAASGSGNIPAMVFTNTSNATQTVTFVVTSTPPSPNICPTTLNVTVTIYAPLALPSISETQTVCAGSRPTTLLITNNITGGQGNYTYAWQSAPANTGPWTTVATSATYWPPVTNTNTPTTFYQVTVTDPCGSQTSNIVSVAVVNNVNFAFSLSNSTATVCAGAPFNPTITSGELIPDSYIRYSWLADANFISASSGGPTGSTQIFYFFGFPIYAQSTATLPLTAINNTNATVISTVFITPTVFDADSNAAICNLSPRNAVVTIRPKATATRITPEFSIFCSGATTNITLAGNITDAQTSYTWTKTVVGGANVTSTLAANATGQAINAGQQLNLTTTLGNTTANIGYVEYTFTPRGIYGTPTTACNGDAIRVRIYIAPNVNAGTLSPAQNVCVGGDPANIVGTTPVSGANVSYQWYSSQTGVAGSYSIIPGATASSYDPPAGISQTTYFIRETIVTSSAPTSPAPAGITTTCSNMSPPVIITVNEVDPGEIAGNQTICAGGSIAPFTVVTPASGTPTITYRWSYNTTGCGTGTWTPIPGAAGAVEAYAPPSGSVMQTTYFRRVTTPNTNVTACADESICITVRVNSASPGTIGGDQAICPGELPVAMGSTVNATADGIPSYQWQSNTTGCSGAWADIPGAQSETYNPGALSQTTYFRRITYSTLGGVTCESAPSNCVTITVNNIMAGQIAPNMTICNGGTPGSISFTVPATGTSLSYQWQSSPNAAGPYTDIALATLNNHTPSGITQTTYFQCVVTSTVGLGSCNQITNFVTVFVNNVTAATITGAQSICAGEDPGALSISAVSTATGAISYQWQSSLTGSAPWTNVGTGLSYDPPALAQTTYYQVVTTSLLNTVSCTATSNVISIINNGKTWNGSANANWNNPANWTPSGIPAPEHCVNIPDVAINPVISGSAYVAFAKNITVQNGGHLTVESGNTIEVTNFVNVINGGTFFVKDDASLVQLDNVGNTGIVRVQRITPAVYKFDYTYWNSPVTFASGFTLGNLSPGTQPDKYYSWNPSVGGGNGNWTQEGVATIMNPNKGYIVRAPNSHGIDPAAGTAYEANFYGTPNNGNFTAPIGMGTLPATTVNDKLNLIGNPYPSALDADAFLSHSTNVSLLEGTIYFWTHNSPPSASNVDPFYGNFTNNYASADYATYTLGMGGTATMPGGIAPTGKIATGQSFFAKAVTSGNAVFDNTMRVRGENNVFFKAGNLTTSALPTGEKHRIWLNLANSQGAFSQILVGYADGATDGKDRNFDGETFAGNAVTFYSTFDNMKFTVQGKAMPFEVSDEVPLGYKATIASTFTIGIDHLDGLFEDRKVYLEDKSLNVMHDLKTAPYTFTSVTGTFDNRFVLRYADSQLGTGDPQLSTGVTVFLTDDVISAKSATDMESITIYDISGKKVVTYELSATDFKDEFLFAQGVYIAKVRLADGRNFEIKLAK